MLLYQITTRWGLWTLTVLGVAGENAEFDPGLKYAGQWLDEESRLVYNRFRYYSTVVGCYLTPDLLGLPSGENLYAYVPNPTG
ncbi:RHS repeat-associated core domain-containing protein [Xenorhabdus bovienii]|nr:RHS repeat-associated core domain-containing protein [Xenorhabdus bovienii]